MGSDCNASLQRPPDAVVTRIFAISKSSGGWRATRSKLPRAISRAWRAFAADHGTRVDRLDRARPRGARPRPRWPAAFRRRSAARLVACCPRLLPVSARRRATCATNPADDLHAPRALPVAAAVPPLEDVDALIAAPDVTTPRGLRDRALIEVLYATGPARLGAGRPAHHRRASRCRVTCTVSARAASNASCRSGRGRRLGDALPRGGPAQVAETPRPSVALRQRARRRPACHDSASGRS